jgi:hypothetical protein
VDTRVLVSQASGRRSQPKAPAEDDLEWDSANDLGNSHNSLAAAALDEVIFLVYGDEFLSDGVN